MVGGDESPVERRRHPRHPVTENATILIGPTSLGFGETLNWSRGGACVRPPTRFAVRIGELLSLASAHLGSERAARVVDVTTRGVHCAFEPELLRRGTC